MCSEGNEQRVTIIIREKRVMNSRVSQGSTRRIGGGKGNVNLEFLFEIL